MADLSLVFDLLARDRASSEVDKVGDSMRDAGDQADGLGDRVSGMFGMLAGAAAGAGVTVGAAFMGAVERESSTNLLGAQLGLPPDMAAEMGAIAGNLYAANYGESVADTTAAIRATMQSGLLPEDATNEQIEAITGRALSLAQAMGVDVADAANAAGQMMQTGLAANGDEALDLIARGMQQGADRGGDLLDVIGEYGTTFTELGLSGAQSIGLLDQALAAGVPNADFAADALREMGIIGREAGEGAAAALESLGLSSADYFAAMQEGGPAASAALDQVLDRLRSTEDPALRSAAAAELVGTQYGDLGDAILQMDPSAAVAGLGTIEGAAAGVDAALAQGLGPALGELKRGLETTATEGMTALVAGFTQGKTDAEGWQGTVQNIGATLESTLRPPLEWLGAFLTDPLGPALSSLFGTLSENQTTVQVVAGLIGGALAAAFVVWGTRATIAAAQNVIAWFTTVFASTTGAAASKLSALQVVASWVLMGAQALINAARMAAAWLIAMGPIGWVIAAVVGIVALIIANWDTVKAYTLAAWQAVVGGVRAAWEWIKGAIKTGLDFVVGLFLNFTGPGLIIKHWDSIVAFTRNAWNAVTGAVSGAWNAVTGAISSGVSTAVSFVAGLPGRIAGYFSGFGSLLYDKGRDLINGLINGARSLLANIGRTFLNIVPSWIRGPFESALGISSPSTVFYGYGQNIGQGLVDGIDAMRPAVADAVSHLVPPDVSRVVWGEVSESVWQQLKGQGWRGRAGDAMEALYRPAAAAAAASAYRPPAYDVPAPGAGGGGATYVTTVSGVASPEQVAAEVERAQRTNEFLAGAR